MSKHTLHRAIAASRTARHGAQRPSGRRPAPPEADGLDQAAERYVALLGNDPADLPSLCRLCLNRLQAGHLDEALRLGRRATRLAAGSAEAWFSLGSVQAARGDAGEAAASFRRVIALWPAFADGHHGLGRAFLALGRPQEALPCFARATLCKPDFAQAFTELGATLGRLGRQAEAVAPLRHAVHLHPQQGEAYFHLGNALQSLGRGDAAAVCFRQAAALDPTGAATYANLGTVLKILGQFGRAIAALERAASLAPGAAAIHANLGDAFHAAGLFDKAIGCYEEALALAPAYVDAHYGLGNCLSALNRHAEAIEHFRAAIAGRPGFVEAHNNLGSVLLALGRSAEATLHFRAAIALHPEQAKPYNNLGSALQAQGRAEQALGCYRKAIRLSPGYAEAHFNAGTAFTDLGELDEAYRAFTVAVDRAPRRGAFHRQLAETGRVGPADPYFHRMEELGRDMAALPETDQIELHFALAKIYGDDGRHEQSFRHLLAGNRMKRTRLAYDEAATLAMFDRIRAVFTPDLLAALPGAGNASPVPIFIVGMPRSGTTLIEQILASHPDIFGAGELLTLSRLARRLAPVGGFPEIAATLSAAQWTALGSAYLDEVRPQAPRAARIVDKMPANFKLLGLIRLALPQARIIHVRRDPVDTCLSSFAKLFSGGQGYAYDLAELGRYYRAYERLMEHWRAVLPAGVLLELQYEEVVADLAGQARRLLAHCGMAWDDRCLAFHQTRRMVRTASATQVRRPLYGTSVGRWQVYGDMAQPLFEALGLGPTARESRW